MTSVLGLIDWPPVWLLLFSGTMWVLSLYFPGMTWSLPGLAAFGYLIIVCAIGLMIWSALHFYRLRTTIVPRREPNALVTGGLFRWSRNPIYLADVLVLLGWSLILQSLVPFVMVPAFAVLIERHFIRGEEAVLRSSFPERYHAYYNQTRRWI